MPTLQRTRLHQKSLHAVRAHAASRASLSCRVEDVRSDGFRDPQGQLNVGSGVRFGSQNGTLARCHRSSSASALCSVL